MKFEDISTEKYRVYQFLKDGMLVNVSIKKPRKLHVSPTGSHRIVDAYGFSHYIPAGWLKIFWKVKKGKPHFSF